MGFTWLRSPCQQETMSAHACVKEWGLQPIRQKQTADRWSTGTEILRRFQENASTSSRTVQLKSKLPESPTTFPASPFGTWWKTETTGLRQSKYSNDMVIVMKMTLCLGTSEMHNCTEQSFGRKNWGVSLTLHADGCGPLVFPHIFQGAFIKVLI